MRLRSWKCLSCTIERAALARKKLLNPSHFDGTALNEEPLPHWKQTNVLTNVINLLTSSTKQRANTRAVTRAYKRTNWAAGDSSSGHGDISDFHFAIGAKGERVSFNKWAEHRRRGEPQTPAAVLSRSYVTLMQTRLSAADVQPGSDGLLSHRRQHTAVKPFNAHGTLGAGWSIPAGLDANLRDTQRNVRQDGEDGGVGMNEEAD